MKLKLRKPAWNEKRDSIRLELECAVVYRTIGPKFLLMKKVGKPVQGLMIKPSLAGMRICSKEEIPAGSQVQVDVEMEKLGYDRSYHLKGEVVWSEFSGKTKRFEHGVRISGKSEDARPWEDFMIELLKNTDRPTKDIKIK